MLLRIIFLFNCLQLSFSFWFLSEVDREHFSTPAACQLIPGLSARQREICHRQPETMKFVVDGLKLALEECQFVFKGQVWNCSSVARTPMKVASKESAYVYAIASAGMTHSLARACAKGLIPDCNCANAPSPGQGQQPKDFVWAGCSDNARYGNSFGRKFIDASEKQHSDPKGLMNVHNAKVGRRLLSNKMEKQCKCHGVSGSCVTKTCWKVVPKFDKFAAQLFDKYEMAQQVTAAPNSNQLMVRSPSIDGGRSERYLKQVDAAKAAKNELVFLDSSPDYCVDGGIDSRGRECGDNCKQICCGRGYHSVREIVDEPCECKFIWCCEVKCKTCKRVVELNYCK